MHSGVAIEKKEIATHGKIRHARDDKKGSLEGGSAQVPCQIIDLAGWEREGDFFSKEIFCGKVFFKEKTPSP